MNTNDAPQTARRDLEAWRAAAGRNPLDDDGFFLRLLRARLGDELDAWTPRLRRVAVEAGRDLDPLVAESNRDENLPALRRHDGDGRPIERVVFHPAYHEIGKAFWASGVLSVLGEPGRERVSGALAYLLDQHGEAGHACPVACTAGAIKLIRRVGTPEQRSRYLPGLLDEDYARRIHASQFVTEIQGGSDVGLNACVAEPTDEPPGHYRIRGEKWFCSVADAQLFVVSARIVGADPGTKGLGLFLVPRTIDGRPNGFALRRLKGKLGTRSMATGEIELDGALAEPIGRPEDGFRHLVEIVLDTSRVHNALGSCGLMRRAFVEADRFARHRHAFRHAIVDFPAVRETLARMKLRSMVGLTTTFRVLEMSDRLEASNDERLAASRRIAVMVNKYRTSVAATHSARDGIEILGGNGTIEEFSCLPRLYRDAIVFESWEGTHNTLCAQVVRDFARYSMHEPWAESLREEIERVTHAALADSRDEARRLYGSVVDRIEALLSDDPRTAGARMRHVVDRMGFLTERVALLVQAAREVDVGGDDGGETLAALRLHELQDADPLTETRRAEAIDALIGNDPSG